VAKKREIPFKACSYLHPPPLSHRNARNVAPRWDGNLSGSRAVRVGISRMDELVYIVPRVNRSCVCLCVGVLHIFLLPSFGNLLLDFSVQFAPHTDSLLHLKCPL
jgi:hypothetical protein